MLSYAGSPTERCPGEAPRIIVCPGLASAAPAGAVARFALHRQPLRICCPALPSPTSAVRQPIELSILARPARARRATVSLVEDLPLV